MRIDPVVDTELLLAADDAWFDWEGGRGASAADWEAHPDLTENGRVRFSFGGFLLRGGLLGDRVVLIDCGNGPQGDEVIGAGALPASLRALGVDPGEVTDVIVTHLHYDHTGWLAPEGVITFPSAAVHVAAADIAYFTAPASPGRSAAVTPERLDAVSAHLVPFSGPLTVAPGLDLVPAPGHTPGSTVVVASDGVRRIVFLGDVVHCPIQLVDEEWAAMSDVDPVQARRTREALVRELEGADVGGAHFPGLRLGRLVVSERPRRWSGLG